MKKTNQTEQVLLNSCTVSNNSHQGVKYVFHDRIPDKAGDSIVGTHDLCTSASTFNPVYPIPILAESLPNSLSSTNCEKRFTAINGQVLTLHFIHLMADADADAEMRIHDGPDGRSPQIAQFRLRNDTRPQSVTTTRNSIWIVYSASASGRTVIQMELTSGYAKSYDLNVTDSLVSNNGVGGLLVENIRSLLHVQGSTIRENGVAGIRMMDGAGDVNVTRSTIACNYGDGINMTYSGGRVNISYSSIESNSGYGLVTWFNQTTNKMPLEHHVILAYNKFALNKWTAAVVGNFCSAGSVNVSSNVFNQSLWNAVDIQSCWKPSAPIRSVFVGHNQFLATQRIALQILPAVSISADIQHNLFRNNRLGCLLIRNGDALQLEALPADIVVTQNRFVRNSGLFVANVGLSQYGETQKLLFIRNWLKRNRIRQAFASLHPRSRVAAVLVIGSSNVNVTRNMIDNPESSYEIGSQLEDHSQRISAVRNWLGAKKERSIFYRIFDLKDRYNLAPVTFKPFLLHDTNYDTDAESSVQDFVPTFLADGSREIGGEITGQEELVEQGVYHVTRDIVIHPSGRLTVAFGVTLRFEHTLGMMIGGELVAEGSSSADGQVTFTMMDRIATANETADPPPPVRLVGGSNPLEGRLQILHNGGWGSICSDGFTQQSAAVACQQLGLVLNPHDWLLDAKQLTSYSAAVPVILSHVDCGELDTDIRHCAAEQVDGDGENYCSHDQDVALRCHDVSWAGLRFGMTAKKSILKSATVERAGLYDYATHAFQPAIRIDLHHHVLERLNLVNNDHDGLGIIYSDIYYPEAMPSLKWSVISNNRGHGVSVRSLGVKMADCTIEGNQESGVHYNPVIQRQELREMVGWLSILKDENFIVIPDTVGVVELLQGVPRYLKTNRVKDKQVESSLILETDQRNVIGMQVINPIQKSSTEEVIIDDYGELTNEFWNVRVNLTSFPTVSSSYRVTVNFRSGADAKGGMVILLTAFKRSDLQVQRSAILPGPVPMLSIARSFIRRNNRGISSVHYNRFLSPNGHHYLRKANETIQVVGCEITGHRAEAVRVDTPYRDVGRYPLAEIKYVFNYTKIQDNRWAIVQTSRDLRDSNNLFHWIVHNNTISNNGNGGVDLRLPYVWQYNENYTHSVYVNDNIFQSNRNFRLSLDGHFARVNITDNHFEDNSARPGLLSLRGMEKQLFIQRNKIHRNSGDFMIELNIDSQSEILGHVSAYITDNVVRDNMHQTRVLGAVHPHSGASHSLALKGVQKANVTDNQFVNEAMDYELLAGIKTSRLNNVVDVQRNYWGTMDAERIRERIFDFDDWNGYAIALYRPFYMEDNFDAGQSSWSDRPGAMDVDRLGGRLYDHLVLQRRPAPYIVYTDLTVMPGVTLTILPGVELEFFPSVGILVLGVLHAEGYWDAPIKMRPAAKNAALSYRLIRQAGMKTNQQQQRQQQVRLCLDGQCASGNNNGYVELFNGTSGQWVPVCDQRFAEHNARVVCRQLGFETFNEYRSFGRRWEFQSNTLSRVRYWPEPIQCSGSESSIDDCEIRMNGQVYDHVYSCPWDGDFVYIHCGDSNPNPADYWGGIRFSVQTFEESVHDIHRGGRPSHRDDRDRQSLSKLFYVHISGAGILHGEKSPAVLSVLRSPAIQQVNVTGCASDGISFISPSSHLPLIDNRIENNMGVGLNILMLNGETRDAQSSSFSPLRHIHGLPYNTFGILDACDPEKKIIMEERMLIYYRYDNHPADCVKIFTSFYGIKTFGFRLLQLNLVNSSGQPWEPDSLTLYDGDIYNVTSTVIARVVSTTTGPGMDNQLYRTKKPSLSLKFHSSGADGLYGFIAEVITLPVAAIGFGRNIRHNISYSAVLHNRMGAIRYSSAGEINPVLTMEWNQLQDNGVHLYGNFSTSSAAIAMNVQNMETLLFRNNLLQRNQGGLKIEADSNGLPTSLKAVIHNNVFTDNAMKETLYLRGRRPSPYQEVTLYHNYVTRSNVPYRPVILIDQVVINFNENYVFNSVGFHIMEVYGLFGRIQTPIYQSFHRNSFHKNFATDRDNRGTIIAGSNGQRYYYNVLVNPDNDYEMIALNWTSNATWETSKEMEMKAIEAAENWWGYNKSTAVVGKMRDFRDVPELLRIHYDPYIADNRTVLSGKCDPGWTLVGDTCYLYMGVPMNFTEAKNFCKKDNASLPYLMSNYYGVMEFLQSQQKGFDYYSRVWVQHLDMIGQCVVFINRRVERSPCDLLLPFLCEADPLVKLDPFGWTDDTLTVALLGSSAAALLLVLLCVIFWVSKSRHRASQRFERRNSIRASIRSSRSFNSLASSSGFLDSGGVRRKPLVAGKSDRFENGSVDSIAKSQFNSSVEDNRSFDIYEIETPVPQGFSYSQLDSRRPAAAAPSVNTVAGHAAARQQQQHPHPHPHQQPQQPNYNQLTFENQGFRDNSTYTSHPPSHAPSDYWDDSSSVGQHSSNTASVSVHHNGVVSYQPQGDRSHDPDYGRARSHSGALAIDHYSTGSIGTNASLNVNMKPDLNDSDAASAITLPAGGRKAETRPKAPSALINRPPMTTRSEQQLLETNFDMVEAPRHAITTPYLATSNENILLGKRSQSTPLETDM